MPRTAADSRNRHRVDQALTAALTAGMGADKAASHAELRKLKTRLDLIANSTRKLGGLYVYANATGVDGDARILFDGSSMVICNGTVLAQGSQFSLVGTMNVIKLKIC